MSMKLKITMLVAVLAAIFGAVFSVRQSATLAYWISENPGLTVLVFSSMFIALWFSAISIYKNGCDGSYLASGFYSAAPVAMFAVFIMTMNFNPTGSILWSASAVEKVSKVNENHFIIDQIKVAVKKADYKKLEEIEGIIAQPISTSQMLQLKMLENALVDNSPLKSKVTKWVESGVIGRKIYEEIISEAVKEPNEHFSVSREDALEQFAFAH